jgi:hypothetical protein
MGSDLGAIERAEAESLSYDTVLPEAPDPVASWPGDGFNFVWKAIWKASSEAEK